MGSVLKSTKSLTDIIEKMRHDFGIPITTGNIRQRGALGMYGVKRQTIRSKNANDLPIIAHELGHHLDNIYKLTFDIGLAGDELVGGLDHEFKLQYAPEEYLGEGLAEFMRKYLQNTETAKIDYP